MGMCSYCYEWQRDECFGWPEARVCGITGPDDPKRIASKGRYEAAKVLELRAKAQEIRRSAEKDAAALDRRADLYESALAKDTSDV